MSFPEELTLIPVTGRIEGVPDGADCLVTFTCNSWLNSPLHDVMVPAFVIRVSAPGGQVPVTLLPPNDHPDWDAEHPGWKYQVSIQHGHEFIKATMNVPYDTLATLSLSDVLQFTPSAPTLPQESYVLVGEVGAPGGVAPLDGNSKVPSAHLPDAFSGAVILTEQAAPAPVADQIRMYATDLDGNTVPRMMLPEGIVIDPVRDTSFVVRNATGGPLVRGLAVYANGIHPGLGGIPTVAPARADSLATLPVIGLLIEDIPNNSFGRVMTQGRVENLNTSLVGTGQILYLSATTAGQLITNPPDHPNYLVAVGVCIRSHGSSGSVAVQLGGVRGAEFGTARNTFGLGDNLPGLKELQFKNGFTGILRANPTAARTWTLPDASGVVVLTADLTAYLTKIAPLVTDTTFTVVRSGGGAIRWRSTGGAADIEIVGDVLESAYPNQDFTGTQQYIRRLRGGGGNTLVALTEFGSTPYTSEQRIDSRSGEGVAYLGAKNGLTNVGICGFKATPGAPTTGTWNTNDVVLATDGTWRCIASGTPGTWSLLTGSATYQPEDQNMIGWTFNPGDNAFGTAVVPTAGLVHFARIKLLKPVLTNLHVHLTAGGSALTSGQCFMAVYNDANALLGPGAVTASLHGTGANGWGDAGFKTHPLNTPMGVEPGKWYRVAWWFNGTTGPTFTRASNAGSSIVNAGLTAGTSRYGTANAGVTTTAPANLTGHAGGSTAWYVSAS